MIVSAIISTYGGWSVTTGRHQTKSLVLSVTQRKETFMKKSERLNDMMLYINHKKSFNLKDIMDKYSISKSTAIRDIQSLEEIGMPIYSQPGRNGYYGVIPNRLLSPIVFTVDEVYSLYFSMLTLRSYETTPFHFSIEKLKKKFEGCLSNEKINMLYKMEEIFSLGSIKHNNECVFLKDIVYSAIEERVCEILYRKQDLEKKYIVQFFDISSSFGQWYGTAYDFESRRTKVFRCDKILSLEEINYYEPKALDDLKKPAEEVFKNESSTEFKVVITKKGVDVFHKEHYPSMKLYFEEGEYFIEGFYNKGEENFISNYLISYGENIKVIEPVTLKNLIIEKLDNLKNYFFNS